MRPFLKIVLITLGVMAVVYGVYLLLGRPAIPLPAYRMQIAPGNQLYDLVKSTESDEMKLTLVTSGHIVAEADQKEIAAIDYTPKSLQNTLDLADKFQLLPAPQTGTDKFIRKLPMPIVQALYHTIRVKLSVIFTAN